MTYLRCSIGRWIIDLTTEEGEAEFQKIREQGLAVFRQQPGFISYRLMLADRHTTVAVAEWESPDLGHRGADNYRQWLRESGIWDKLALETLDGDVVVSS